jgi:hypothetical protein
MSTKYRFESGTGTVFFLDSGSKLALSSCSRDGEWTLRLDWRGKTFPVIARLKQNGEPPGDVFYHWTIINLPGAALEVPTDKFGSVSERAQAIRETAEAIAHLIRHSGPRPGEIPHITASLSKSLEEAIELDEQVELGGE